MGKSATGRISNAHCGIYYTASCLCATHTHTRTLLNKNQQPGASGCHCNPFPSLHRFAKDILATRYPILDFYFGGNVCKVYVYVKIKRRAAKIVENYVLVWGKSDSLVSRAKQDFTRYVVYPATPTFRRHRRLFLVRRLTFVLGGHIVLVRLRVCACNKRHRRWICV